MSDIICVTNRKLCQDDFLTRIRQIASCRPAGIILREKDMKAEDYKELAEAVIEICRQYGVMCILHSFFDAAISLEAEAVHLPLYILRGLSNKQKDRFRILGASCHSMAEALEAQSLGCTYITVGHLYETECKKGLEGKGTEFLKMICSAVDIPVYGIGGINADNIAAVREAGAKGVCLMSAFMASENIAGIMKAMEG